MAQPESLLRKGSEKRKRRGISVVSLESMMSSCSLNVDEYFQPLRPGAEFELFGDSVDQVKDFWLDGDTPDEGGCENEEDYTFEFEISIPGEFTLTEEASATEIGINETQEMEIFGTNPFETPTKEKDIYGEIDDMNQACIYTNKMMGEWDHFIDSSSEDDETNVDDDWLILQASQDDFQGRFVTQEVKKEQPKPKPPKIKEKKPSKPAKKLIKTPKKKPKPVIKVDDEPKTPRKRGRPRKYPISDPRSKTPKPSTEKRKYTKNKSMWKNYSELNRLNLESYQKEKAERLLQAEKSGQRLAICGQRIPYTKIERKEAIGRFLSKRKNRNWRKQIKYQVRKSFADSRLRVKGRFIKKEDEDVLREALLIIH